MRKPCVAVFIYGKGLFDGSGDGRGPAGELELRQPHMAQRPMLRGEVDARALRVRCVYKLDRGWFRQALSE